MVFRAEIKPATNITVDPNYTQIIITRYFFKLESEREFGRSGWFKRDSSLI